MNPLSPDAVTSDQTPHLREDLIAALRTIYALDPDQSRRLSGVRRQAQLPHRDKHRRNHRPDDETIDPQ